MAIGNLWYNDFHLPTLPLPAIELDASTSDIKIHSDRQLVQKKKNILEAKNLLK